MIRQNYRGTRFNAKDVPLLRTTWEALDNFDEERVIVNLEVLSGKNYQRQIITEHYGRRMGQTAYLLQVLITSKVDSNMNWSQVTDAMNSPIELLRKRVEGIVPDLDVYTTEGITLPPRNAGAFGSESTEDGVVHIHQPLLQVTHQQDDGRLVELRAAGVAPINHFMVDVHPVSFDDSNNHTIKAARKGWVVIPSPEQLQEES